MKIVLYTSFQTPCVHSCGEFRHYYKTKRLLFRPVLAF